MLTSEKKSLFRFLGLYFVTTFVLLLAIALSYYFYQKHLIVEGERSILEQYAIKVNDTLKFLHQQTDGPLEYPRDERFESAILDGKKRVIFSTFDISEIEKERTFYNKGDFFFLVHEIKPYFLGAKYIVIKSRLNTNELDMVKKEIAIVFAGSLLFVMIAAYFLAKTFLAPMRQSINLLDRFIKDTAHELGTPLSAILTSTASIDKTELSPKTSKKIERIEIAAKTISNLYEDLTILLLGHKTPSKDEAIDMVKLARERIEQFGPLMELKKIECSLEGSGKSILHADRSKVAKMIDNILGNAIKYNKMRGSIAVYVGSNYISIKDSGIGIAQEKIKEIFDRYRRLDDTVGGFGIGLSIVAMIAKEYGISIDITSQIGKGTEVVLRW